MADKSPGELVQSYGRNYLKMLPVTHVVSYVKDEIDGVKALVKGDAEALGNIAGRNFANASVNAATQGVGVGIGRGISALRGATSSGLGDLTTSEVKSIQSVVNEAGRPLDVPGSAAQWLETWCWLRPTYWKG